jgi:hypothetical protein
MGGIKFPHATWGDAEAFDAWALLAGLKEELVAKADAEVGAVFFEPFFERLPEMGFLQDADTVAKGPLSGEDEDVDVVKALGLSDEFRLSADGGEGIDDAAEIASAVVEHT